MLVAWQLMLVASAAAADFNVSSVFGSDMVLQQAPALAAVYGFGSPGTKVTATVTTAVPANVSLVSRAAESRVTTTTVADDGSWKVVLGTAYKGGTVAAITLASGPASIKLERITFGDVYFWCALCAIVRLQSPPAP